MKKVKITYWATTALFFIFDGVMPALTFNSDLAKEGTRHLGYPDYFLVMLTVFKVVGAIVLILPMVPARYKEWAYAGFGFTLIAALVSNWAVDGFSAMLLLPIIVFGVLAASYISYHKLHQTK